MQGKEFLSFLNGGDQSFISFCHVELPRKLDIESQHHSPCKSVGHVSCKWGCRLSSPFPRMSLRRKNSLAEKKTDNYSLLQQVHMSWMCHDVFVGWAFACSTHTAVEVHCLNHFRWIAIVWSTAAPSSDCEPATKGHNNAQCTLNPWPGQALRLDRYR